MGPLLWLACGGAADPTPPAGSPLPATAETGRATAATGDSASPGTRLRVVTWNTGTTPGLPHDDAPDDGYTSADAALSDAWYGDGLAWRPAVEAARAWLAATDPDLVVFQELFHSDACASIPPEAHGDFVCADWQPGDPTVAEAVLGPDYTVGCFEGKTDKCIAVHARLGGVPGCASGVCLDHLDGATVPDCGSGSRVGRLLLDALDLVVVGIHGTSGLGPDDQACRVAQVEQVFVDLDGAPAASGARNLVLGDLNTDPGRFAAADASAARWLDFVGDDRPFAFHTEVGPDAPGSYGGLTDIDHVMSDALAGSCWIAGVSEGHPAVLDAVYFDHHPVVCDLVLP